VATIIQLYTILCAQKSKGIVCIGLDTTRIHEAFEDLDIPMTDALSMEEAVQAAYYMGNNVMRFSFRLPVLLRPV